jgi:hypothetical protein
MKSISWKAVDAHLRKQSASHGMRDAETFAADFKARAALAPQNQPGTTRNVRPFVFHWGYAAVLATILIMAGLFSLPDRSVAETRIRALEIIAPHSGVIIMDDTAGRGTIIWVAGMESNNNKG